MIVKMFVTMVPVIMAGVMNMVFVKTKFCKRISFPIDRGKTFTDGRRIFGDNKTWAGFCGMVIFGALSQIIWGAVCKYFLDGMNNFYTVHENTFIFNAISGAIAGFVYVLFELPNSFIKRRLEIPCGKTANGIKGTIFYIIDQIDSLIGVALVFAFIFPMKLWEYFLYIFIGAFIHSAVNLILWKAKIRKNI